MTSTRGLTGVRKGSPWPLDPKGILRLSQGMKRVQLGDTAEPGEEVAAAHGGRPKPGPVIDPYHG